MLIVYEHPGTCSSEREYIANWVLGEVLGFEVEHEQTSRNGQYLRLRGERGRVSFPDVFFPAVADQWLSDVPEYGKGLGVQDQGLVAPYGVSSEESEVSEFDTSIDLLGSLFFLISRYEEAVSTDRDVHDRFRGECSWMGKVNLLGRAIGNEYIEKIWELLKQVWPQLERRPRTFALLPSHDIDHPSAYWSKWSKCLRGAARHLANGRVKDGLSGVWNRVGYGHWISWRDDPADTISWLIEASERTGRTSTFYYIPEQTDARRDAGMPIAHPHVCDQWKRISEAGHKIGVHPGYSTYRSPERIRSAADKIRVQFDRLGIEQKEMGGRQHYLRWATPETARAYEGAELDHDSTLGYAEVGGFRSGVCYEYPLYDLGNRKSLRLRERPLVLMDATLTGEQYLNLGLGSDGFDYAMGLRRECERFCGDFTLLWHNNRLGDDQSCQFYRELIS